MALNMIQATENFIKTGEELEKAERALPPVSDYYGPEWKNYRKVDKAFETARHAYWALLTPEQRLYGAVFGVEGHELFPTVPQIIWQVVATLGPREEIILQLRFGRFGYCNTLETTGKVLGVSGERIRQIEAKALRKLRHPTRSRTIKAMVQGRDWSIDIIKTDSDFIPYWTLRTKQAMALGMKPYTAHCLLQLAYQMKRTNDYRTPDDLTEDDLLHKRGIGPKTLTNIKRFFSIRASKAKEDASPQA